VSFHIGNQILVTKLQVFHAIRSLRALRNGLNRTAYKTGSVFGVSKFHAIFSNLLYINVINKTIYKFLALIAPNCDSWS